MNYSIFKTKFKELYSKSSSGSLMVVAAGVVVEAAVVYNQSTKHIKNPLRYINNKCECVRASRDRALKKIMQISI